MRCLIRMWGGSSMLGENSLMLKLYSMKVPQGDIAKMLNKSKSDVNVFLKPVANREKK